VKPVIVQGIVPVALTECVIVPERKDHVFAALAAHVEQACMELMEPAVVVLMELVCVDKCPTVHLIDTL